MFALDKNSNLYVIDLYLLYKQVKPMKVMNLKERLDARLFVDE